MKSHRAMRVLTDDQLRRWRDDQAAIVRGMSRSTRLGARREVRHHQRMLDEINAEIAKRSGRE